MTIIDILRHKSLHHPNKSAYIFLANGETEQVNLTYQELDRQSRVIAAQLQSLDATGKRVLLLYPPSLEFIIAFFGCLYAGVVAVPAYPPQHNQKRSRLQAIVASSQATLILTTTSNLAKIKSHSIDNTLDCLTTDNLVSNLASDWQEPAVSSETLAFLQYTSGSTSTPKGVMINHGNLLHNLASIHKCFAHTPKSKGVIWLPPYHDMGLIGGILQPLYAGFPVTLMSPVDFLQKPLRWLQAISRYKATTSGGPNFAYELCVRKIKPEDRANLDLSSWKVAFTGAEPVRAETLERFASAFEPCGFRWEAFYPCYGMAETTLIVSGGLKTSSPVFHQIRAAALEQNRVVAAVNEQEDIRTIVGCGQTWSDQKIVIVDPESLTMCPTGKVGEIWVSGSSVAQGYWNKHEETKQTFHAYLADTCEGPFLRTGDLGFLLDGELFVTGRLKDMIIIRGHNYYPQDVELTVEESHPALRSSYGAAFAVEANGSERLVVVQEVERSYLRDLNVDEVVEDIHQAVSEQHGLRVYAVVLVKTGSIPKTSSNKVQRYACRNGFLTGSLNVVGDWSEDIQRETNFLHLHELPEYSLTRQALIVLNPEQRQSLLESYLQKQAVKIIGLKVSKLDIHQPLSSLGLDSMMAVELKNMIEDSIGIIVPLAKILECSSIAALSTYLLEQLATVTPRLSAFSVKLNTIDDLEEGEL
jgi:acyl-CoA synthetase (AMP-forming)/AMP-acid ligase II/acyl carrier protein